MSVYRARRFPNRRRAPSPKTASVWRLPVDRGTHWRRHWPPLHHLQPPGHAAENRSRAPDEELRFTCGAPRALRQHRVRGDPRLSAARGPLTDASISDAPVWRNRAFLCLWVAQALTQTAQNAIWFALLVVVEEASHSTTQLGITILSVILPSVLFGVPAGVYVDRWDKRSVLLATNLARCVIVLGYIVVGHALILLYAVSFLFSVITQF